jgi:hypothetical protein
MTSICYRAGRLAMDTAVNGDDTFCGRIFKGGKTEDGHLWAVTGYTHYVSSMRVWVEKREGDPPVMEDSTLILITPEGVVRTWESKGWCEIQAEYYAWGSGEKFALGAMAVGASADEAVEAACRHDPWSSEPMLVEVLGETPEVAEPIAAEGLIDPGAPPAETWKEQRGL